MSCLNFSGKVMMFPTCVTEISNFNFEALLKFRAFIKNKFSIKSREKIFCCFGFILFLCETSLFTKFLHFLFTFLLPFLNFSSQIFTLVFVHSFIFQLFFELFNFSLNLFGKLWFLFFVLFFSFMIWSDMIFFPVKSESVSVQFFIG